MNWYWLVKIILGVFAGFCVGFIKDHSIWLWLLIVISYILGVMDGKKFERIWDE